MDYSQKAGDAGGGGAHTHARTHAHTHAHTHTHTHTFLRSKRKRGRQMEKKERVSKKKLLKVLKGRHESENATVLAILERLKFKIFSC